MRFACAFSNVIYVLSLQVVLAPLNKLQSRFLPFDLIQTEAVITLDDEVVPESKSAESGFK